MNSRMFVLGFFAAVSAFGQPTTTTIPVDGGVVAIKATADLSVTKTLTKPPLGGGPAVFDIVVTNHGPFPAAGPITVTDQIPTGASLASIPGTPWSCSVAGSTLTCTRPGPLSVNNSYILTLTMNGTANPDFGGVNNCATAKSNTFDPKPGNNRDCACANFKPCRDLTIDVSTGSNNGVTIAGGNQDSDWNLVSAPAGVSTGHAWVPSITASWAPAPAGSARISGADPRSTIAGNYHYQFAFALGDEWTGRPCTLSFHWAVDDEAQFTLDNTTLLTTAAFGTGVTGSNHTILHQSNAFPVGPGTHVLDVNVQNGVPGATGNNSPTGLLIKGSVVCKCFSNPHTNPTTSTQ